MVSDQRHSNWYSDSQVPAGLLWASRLVSLRGALHCLPLEGPAEF